MTTYHYRGQRRNGSGVIGTTTTPPEPFVRNAYNARFRWLDFYDGPFNEGELVGSIGPHPDTGKRIWWVQSLTRTEDGDEAVAGLATPTECPRCGKTWINGTCDDTPARRGRCAAAAGSETPTDEQLADGYPLAVAGSATPTNEDG